MKFLAEDIKQVAFEVVHLIPERYFYKPEIDSEEFQQARSEIDELIRKKNFSAYWNDAGLQQKIVLKRQAYDEKIATLVSHKREVMLQELFTRSELAQLRWLEKVIKKFNLKKYMGVFR